MQALVFESPMNPKLQDREVPELRADEALIKIAYNSICGSDLSLFRGVWHGFNYPIVPGHEWSGQVVAVGDKNDHALVGKNVVGDLTCPCGACAACERGDPVLCRDLQELGFSRDGACAEFMAIPVRNLHVLPSDLDLRIACQVEPMSVALHAVDAIGIEPGEKVAVLGAGGIGLMLMKAARLRGAKVTLVSEPVAERRNLASELGAAAVCAAGEGELAALVQHRSELVPDVVMEASGYPVAVQEAMNIVRPGGRICLVGYRTEEVGLMSPHVATVKALSIRGVLGPGGRFQDAIEVLRHGKEDIDPLLTHEFSLGEFSHALDIGLNRTQGNVRSMFCMQ